MPINQTTILKAIVLNGYPYQEYNRIIQVFSKKYGLVSISAQGVEKENSKNKIALDLFSLSNLEVFFHKFGVHKLKKATLIKENSYFFNNYFIYLIFNLFMEVLKKNNYFLSYPFLFEIWEDIIKNEGKNILIKTNCFLLKNLKNQGARLNLLKCYRCYNKKKIISFSFKEFGFICKYCFQKKDPILSYCFLKIFYILQTCKNVTQLNKINDFDYENDIKIIFYFLIYFYENELGFLLTSIKELKKHFVFKTIENEIIKNIKYK